CDRFQLARFRFFQCAPDVFRFAGSRQTNEQIAGKTKRRDLAGKDFIETVIITRGGEKSPIVSQTNCRIPPGIFREAPNQLRCEMSGVSRAASIPADEQFVSRAQTLLDQIRSLRDLRVKIDERFQRLDRVVYRLVED